MPRPRYALGLDFGTSAVRALIARVEDGAEIGVAAFGYPHGSDGVLIDLENADLARQHPDDYIEGLKRAIPQAIERARAEDSEFSTDGVCGIGVGTTGSTPLPVDRSGRALAQSEMWTERLDAMAWLWKDHTAKDEAEEITTHFRERAPEILALCGGTYSSEWFFSKILCCRRKSRDVFEAAWTWVELCDWIPFVLSGGDDARQVVRGACAAGHKALFRRDHGLPTASLFGEIDPALAMARSRLYERVESIDHPAGQLCESWARRLGLPPGIPIATGALDAHMGGVGAGIRPGRLVKILGTSTCDLVVIPPANRPLDISGLCGVAEDSILPGFLGLEAGQSAVGDIYNWFVEMISPRQLATHDLLEAAAVSVEAGTSGLLALDWNNGNRCVLTDPRLTGLLVGQTLHTSPEEIYRALVEGTAFGARLILERIESTGTALKEVVACGGIAEKSALVMQIHADVIGRPMKVASSKETCALGSSIAGASVGLRVPIEKAQASMVREPERVFEPREPARGIYNDLYRLWKDVHDAFGRNQWQGNLSHVMKRLIVIREQERGVRTT